MSLAAKHILTDGVKKYGPNLVIFAVFLFGLYVSYQTLHHVKLQEIYQEIKRIPVNWVLVSIGLTVLSYISLIGYDWSALKYIGKKLPLSVIAFTSFIGFSLSNTVGVSWLSGGALRYRLYSKMGLSTSEIAKIIAFCTIGFGIGEVIVGGTALAVFPDILAESLHLSATTIRILALLMLGGFLALLGLRHVSSGHLALVGRKFQLPGTNILAGQVVFSIFDIAFSGAALYVLLPPDQVPLFGFLAIFAIALVAGVLSHIPGGVGVFEAVIVSTLQKYVPIDAIMAALVCFRAIYFILPFAIGILLLVFGEAVVSGQSPGIPRRVGVGTSGVLVKNIVSNTLPMALAIMTFLSGVFLLLGSSIPLGNKLLKLVGKIAPVSVIEFSHIMGGVIGVVLIILSRAVWQRIRAAWWLGIILFLAGALLVLVQSLDYERAIVMLIMPVLFLISQDQFYRKGRLFANSYDFKWLLLSLGALACFIWLWFFASKSVPYSNELWWKFALDDQVSRGLRTAVAASSTFIIIYIFNALRHHRAQLQPPDENALKQAGRIIEQQDSASANLVFTRDKSLLFSESGESFIMFSRNNNKWIALGDPVGGSDTDRQELIWEFKRQAGDEGCKAVFYEIAPDHLNWYVDAGFNLFKLGEEARIPLAEFDLQGPKRAKLRHALNRAKRENLEFSIHYPPHSDELLDELEEISDEWLSLKHVSEKSFSLGRFNREYLQHFPLALVQEDGKLSAFANVMLSGTKAEASIDLMRHRKDADSSTMDFLFIELIMALKQEGYGEFSLSMAPLSGFQKSEYGRLWDRFGHFVYKNGKRFYNFEGLRRFKQKFDPVWIPRYLATSQKGVGPYLDVIDIATLSGGGIKGVFKK